MGNFGLVPVTVYTLRTVLYVYYVLRWRKKSASSHRFWSTYHRTDFEARHRTDFEVRHRADFEVRHRADFEARHRTDFEARHRADFEADLWPPNFIKPLNSRFLYCTFFIS